MSSDEVRKADEMMLNGDQDGRKDQIHQIRGITKAATTKRKREISDHSERDRGKRTMVASETGKIAIQVMKFLSSNPTPPSSPHGMPTFTLQVTAQAVPLPSRVPNPPITLRLCFFEKHSQLPHLANSMLSQGKEGSAEVCHSREAAVTQYQSNAASFLNPERALKDVRQLLTSLAHCNGFPWVLMPFTLFITDAAARIQRYLYGRLRSKSLGSDRIICHLEVTARYSKHK